MKKNKIHTLFWDISPYLLLGLIPMLLFLVLTQAGWINNPDQIQPFMLLLILLSVCLALYGIKTKGYRDEDLITLLLFAGFVMRIGYMLYTQYNVRAHDIGYLSPDSHGHAPYIWGLFAEHRLPESYSYQFYHPPFFHMMSVIPVKIASLTFPEAANEVWLDASKVVSCFASCSGLLIVRRLCREFSLKQTTTILILGIAALHPNFYLLAGRVNNDSLVIFFQLLILLYTVKWYRQPSVGNTVVLGLAYGLGTMTKLSCATMALFTGPLMVYVWIKNRKTPEFWKIFGKGALFMAICAPLALWYPIRNLILFNQPLNYIPKMGVDHELYCGNYSFVERFFSIPFGSMFERTFCLPVEDYNVPLYLFKCSMFGEFEYDVVSSLPRLLIIVNILLITLSLIAGVYVLIKGKKLHVLLRFGLPYLWLTQLVSYFIFQIQYPFGCTMDFRYIAITAMIGAVLLGTAMELLKETSQKIYRYVHLPVILLILLFGGLSIVTYCVI